MEHNNVVIDVVKSIVCVCVVKLDLDVFFKYYCMATRIEISDFGCTAFVLCTIVHDWRFTFYMYVYVQIYIYAGGRIEEGHEQGL